MEPANCEAKDDLDVSDPAKIQERIDVLHKRILYLRKIKRAAELLKQESAAKK